MGNINNLKTPSLLQNEDLLDFLQLYQPHQSNSTIQPTILDNMRVHLKIRIDNFVFAILDVQYTLKFSKPTKANIPLHFIHSKNMVLVDLQVEEKGNLSEGKFVSILNLLKEEAPTMVDISDSQCSLNVLVQEEMTVSLKLLQPLDLLQGSLYLLQYPLNGMLVDIDLEVLVKSNLIESLTHKLISSSEGKYSGQSQGSQTFEIIIASPTESQCSLHQYPMGHKHYSSEQKYCAMISMTPQQSLSNQFESFMDFNSDAKDYYSTLPCQPTQRELYIFVDQSNSMKGIKQEVMQQALRMLVKSINCPLQIYCYGSSFTKFFEYPGRHNIQGTLALIETMNPNMGSTFLLSALKDSLRDECPKTWFVVTDGIIAEQKAIIELIEGRKDVRVYSFGLGSEFDRDMVQQMGKIKSYICDDPYQLMDGMTRAIQHSHQKGNHNFQLDALDTQNISLVYPNPDDLFIPGMDPIVFFIYFRSEVIEKSLELRFRATFNREQQEEQYAIENLIKFKNAKHHDLIHVYGMSQIIGKILEQKEFLKQFYFLQTSQSQFVLSNHQYQFLSPLSALKINGIHITKNINIQRLQSIAVQRAKTNQKSLGERLTSVFQAEDLRILPAFSQNKQPATIPIPQKPTLIDQTIKRLVLAQQQDGSFCTTEHLPSFTSKTSMNEINETNEENIELPKYIADKVKATVTVLCYLRKYCAERKGEWLHLYIRSVGFLKRSVYDYYGVLKNSYLLI